MNFKKVRLFKYNVTLYTEPTWDWKDPRLIYAIFGKEKTPTTDRTHWQGYIELSYKVRATTVKKWFKGNPRLSMEPIKNREAARAYCMKDATWKEWGTWRENVKTPNKYREIANNLNSGTKTIENIMDEEPLFYCRYKNGLERLAFRSDRDKAKEFREMEVSCYYDPSSMDALKKAYKDHPDNYRIVDGEQWWDGYEGEDVLIIDNWTGDWKRKKMDDLIAGKPKTKLPIKNGFKWAKFTKVIVIAKENPEDNGWYNVKGVQYYQKVRDSRMPTLWRTYQEQYEGY